MYPIQKAGSSGISKILGQFLVFQKIVFSLKNKRFHIFMMVYSESSHQKQQKKKTKKSMLLEFIAGSTLSTSINPKLPKRSIYLSTSKNKS